MLRSVTTFPVAGPERCFVKLVETVDACLGDLGQYVTIETPGGRYVQGRVDLRGACEAAR